MLQINKRDSEVDLLMQQLASQEARIKQAFLSFVSIVKSDEVLRPINALLSVGDVEGALAIVDTHIVRLGAIIPAVYTTVGASAASSIAETLGLAGIGVSFDPTDMRTANIIRTARLNLIRETTEKQREATRQALTRAFETGAGPRQTATAFRDSLGLTAKQELAVQRYRELLERNSKEALTRQLRDRRFDRSVINASDKSIPLTSEKIDTMVTRYRERYVQYRAEAVARTEGVRATSMSRDQAMRQTIEATGISESKVTRIWNRTDDDRTRDAHVVMQGQATTMDGVFIDGLGNELKFPGDPDAPIETTAQCRCVVTFKRQK